MASLQDYLYIADKLNPVTGLAKQAATPVAIAGGLASDAAIDTAAAGLGLNRAKPLGITQDAIAGANEINKPLVKLSDVKTGLAQTLAGHLGLSLPEAKAAPVVDNNPLALSANESVVKPGAKLPAAQPAGYGGALSKFSPAEQQAIIDDAKKSGVSSFGVMYDPNAPVGSGNRVLSRVAQPASVQPVAATAAPVQYQPDLTAEEQNYNGMDAYKARTGIDIQPVLFQPGNGKEPTAEQAAANKAATEAYFASPEYAKDKALQDQYRASAQGNKLVQYLLPGGQSVFHNLNTGESVSANTEEDANRILSNKAQADADLKSALAKPVGAKLTYGEAKAIDDQNASKNATELAKAGIEANSAATVADITGKAHVKGTEVAAEAGKNKILDLAVADINATTDPAARAGKIAAYLSNGKSAVEKTEPMDKEYAGQLIDPKEQATYAALRASGTAPARAFALTKQKSQAK